MNKLITLLLSILLIAGCNGEEEVVESETVDNDENTPEEKYISPEDFAVTTSDGETDVSYDQSSKTFIFKYPARVKYELINENNDFFTDEEYEETLEKTKSDMIDTSNMLIDYYDESYTVIFQLDNEDRDTLFKVEGLKLVENNLDMRQVNDNSNESQSKFTTEKDKQQYEMLGDYIYIDFRAYVDSLEDLIIDYYNNAITQEEFIEDLGKGHSELTYYCTNLLLEGNTENNETLSDDIGKLVSNAFLSCTTLQSTYFNLMLPTSDGVEAGSLLEESINYFEKAKEIYDDF